jgi:hypothetical protein
VKKRLLKYQLIRGFLPKSYLETAFSAGVLAYAFGTLGDFEQRTGYAFFLFFATWSVYNLLRVVSMLRQMKTMTLSVLVDAIHIPIHIALSAISGLIALILLLFLSFDTGTILLIALLFVVTLLYRFKWLVVDQNRVSLSDLPFSKAFLVALTWSALCAALPLQFDVNYGTQYAAAFFYFLGLAIPFDIRDLHFDAKSRRTIPQILGVEKAKQLALFFISLGFFLLDYRMSHSILVLILGLFAHIGLMMQTSPEQNRLWLYRLLDLCPLLYAWYALS